MNDIVVGVDLEQRIRERDRLVELLTAATIAIEEAHQLGYTLATKDVGYGTLRLERMVRQVDRDMWLQSLDDTGLSNLMSSAIKKNVRKLLFKDVPEFTADNIVASYRDFGARIDSIENQGLLDFFQSMSWCHSTNSPVKISRKVIVRGCFHKLCGTNALSMERDTVDLLNDLERVVLRLLDTSVRAAGLTLGNTVYQHFMATNEAYEDNNYRIQGFMVGTMHIFFKRPEFVDMLNAKIARISGAVLVDEKHRKYTGL